MEEIPLGIVRISSFYLAILANFEVLTSAALIRSRLDFRPDDPHHWLTDRNRDRYRVDKTWRLNSGVLTEDLSARSRA